jgi:predicted small lipoprotein YifL
MAISQTSRPWLILAALMVAAGGLSGCGVRGPLDPPAQAKAEGETRSAEAAAAGENSSAPPKPHEPFVLDGLLR